jgi:hypothetical protein
MMNESFISANVAYAREQLAQTGYAVFEGIYDDAFISSAMKVLESDKVRANHESRHFNSELRIWGAEKESPAAQEFMRQSDSFLSAILNKTYCAYTILGQKITPVDKSLSDNAPSRWHIDSLSSQYKIFLYLSETTEENGPLEILEWSEGDYKPSLFFKNPFRFANFKMLFSRNISRPYECLSPNYIKKLQSRYGTKVMTLPPGSIFVAKVSSLIHRARPCESGARYSFTSYYR